MSKRVNPRANKRTSASVSDTSSSPSHPSTMLSVNDAIHGWSPIGGDDEDVNVSPDMHFMTIKPFPATSNVFLSTMCPPLDTSPKTCPPESQTTPSAPLTGVPHASAPSSDRRAQRNRNRDPSWIPRPRNAFIIFRCEYSREHSQGAQDAQSDDGASNPTVKTLSKRAADAWKLLPAPERERYKVLADKEREEHARLYPHYRFRPMKRQVSAGGRRPSQEWTQDPRVPSVGRPPVSSTHMPSVLAPAPKKLRSSPSVERGEESASVPRATIVPLPEPSSSYPTGIDPRAEFALSVDYNDALLSYSFPETARSDSSSPCAPAELYAPLSTSAGSIPPDTFHCHDSAPGVDLAHEDAERAQALEAYAIGLYNYDLLSPFSFPEYY